jgi:hypothetical protein
VFICEILANMTEVSDVAPGPLVLFLTYGSSNTEDWFSRRSISVSLVFINQKKIPRITYFCWIKCLLLAEICCIVCDLTLHFRGVKLAKVNKYDRQFGNITFCVEYGFVGH